MSRNKLDLAPEPVTLVAGHNARRVLSLGDSPIVVVLFVKSRLSFLNHSDPPASVSTPYTECARRLASRRVGTHAGTGQRGDIDAPSLD